MEQWEYFSNKKVKVIYEDGKNADGSEHFSSKTCWIIGSNNTHLIIQIEDKKEAINISKILRVEEVVGKRREW